MRVFIVVIILSVLVACTTAVGRESYHPAAGEWVANSNIEGYFSIGCCDCGLVHTFQVRKNDDGTFAIRGWRDRDATDIERRKRIQSGRFTDICNLCIETFERQRWRMGQ
jgi:hypothetical protein